MNWLKKQIHFTYSLKWKIVSGLILGSILAFIIIFVEPFTTDQYKSDYRLIFLLGFGFVMFVTYVLYGLLENEIYRNKEKYWKISHEILSLITFFVLSGTIIFLYNHLIINSLSYSIYDHLIYLATRVLVMIPIVLPFILYLRQNFGELILPDSPDIINIFGENKNENLTLRKSELIYIQAIENYIDIIYIDEFQQKVSKTFRQSLTKVHNQLPFLLKCHRSYIVNPSKVLEIKGNTQNAKILFEEIDNEIPLSKSLYKEVKNRF